METVIFQVSDSVEEVWYHLDFRNNFCNGCLRETNLTEHKIILFRLVACWCKGCNGCSKYSRWGSIAGSDSESKSVYHLSLTALQRILGFLLLNTIMECLLLFRALKRLYLQVLRKLQSLHRLLSHSPCQISTVPLKRVSWDIVLLPLLRRSIRFLFAGTFLLICLASVHYLFPLDGIYLEWCANIVQVFSQISFPYFCAGGQNIFKFFNPVIWLWFFAIQSCLI